MIGFLQTNLWVVEGTLKEMIKTQEGLHTAAEDETLTVY